MVPASRRSSCAPRARKHRRARALIAALLATPIPNSLRAALFRVAATLPGVTYQGGTHDPLGRAGVAIAVGTGRAQIRMIFDPGTRQLLAEAESAQTTSTIVAQGVVESISALPRRVAPVPGTAATAPRPLVISPRIGSARTTFELTLPSAGSAGQSRRAPLLAPLLWGPTGPGCRFWASRAPFARIPPGTVTRAAGRTAFSYRLAPSAIGRRMWCSGRYELQVTPLLLPDAGSPEQSAIYFDVG